MAAKSPTPEKRDREPAQPVASPDIDDMMLTMEETCEFFGGSRKPIHFSTLYRHAGTRYPRPIKVGAQAVRWSRNECREALRKLMEARDRPPAQQAGTEAA
jgi:predicted DNA-binding transcriptional regulator AlpA